MSAGQFDVASRGQNVFAAVSIARRCGCALARLTPDGQLDGAKVMQYVWDQSYIDTPILRYQDANGDGDTADAGETLYYTTDANHNITGLVGQVLNEQTQTLQWKVVERYVYDAYGKVTICHGNDGSGTDWSPILAGGLPVSASPLGNEILYCGYHYDSETAITTATLTGAFGSYQIRNREYNVLLSQWTTQDPMGYAAGDANLRRYCGNQATVTTDPLGLRELGIRRWKKDGKVVSIVDFGSPFYGCTTSVDIGELADEPVSFRAPDTWDFLIDLYPEYGSNQVRMSQVEVAAQWIALEEKQLTNNNFATALQKAAAGELSSLKSKESRDAFQWLLEHKAATYGRPSDDEKGSNIKERGTLPFNAKIGSTYRILIPDKSAWHALLGNVLVGIQVRASTLSLPKPDGGAPGPGMTDTEYTGVPGTPQDGKPRVANAWNNDPDGIGPRPARGILPNAGKPRPGIGGSIANNADNISGKAAGVASELIMSFKEAYMHTAEKDGCYFFWFSQDKRALADPKSADLSYSDRISKDTLDTTTLTVGGKQILTRWMGYNEPADRVVARGWE